MTHTYRGRTSRTPHDKLDRADFNVPQQTSKYDAVRKAIRPLIADGKPINRKQLTKDLGVSQGTVQRAVYHEQGRRRYAAQSTKPAPARQRPSNVVVLHQNRGYRWRDQDPVVVELCTLMDQSGIPAYDIPQVIATMSHGAASVSKTTIHNILSGKTRRPHNYTVEWIAAAIGWKRQWVRL